MSGFLCNLATARAEPDTACIFWDTQTEDGQTVKNRRGSSWNPKNTGESGKTESASLGATQGITISSLHCSARQIGPPSHHLKIPWQRLGHSTLLIKAGSHLRVQYQMQLCICAQGLRRYSNPVNSHIFYLLFTVAST